MFGAFRATFGRHNRPTERILPYLEPNYHYWKIRDQIVQIQHEVKYKIQRVQEMKLPNRLSLWVLKKLKEGAFAQRTNNLLSEIEAYDLDNMAALIM